jgi:prepilin-type processing-associated H-X9-DG protein
MKRLALFLLITTLALVLAGCNPTVHGGGNVNLLYVDGGPGTYQLGGTATFAISATCNDHKDAMMSTIEWNDQANGVQFHARLPWISISELTDGAFSTCDGLAADFEGQYGVFDGSATTAIINAQGQEVGVALILVGKPGQVSPDIGIDPCGGTAPWLYVTASGTDWSYQAIGCLDRGNIVFQ